MGSSAPLYHLGWSDFDSSFKGAVKGLRTRGDLVDVTLAAGGKTFPAHKLVLAAASTLFLELLKVTPCQHPVILLAGIGAVELEQVLDFVYTGEVKVQLSDLSALLQAAHVLNIHGLVQGSITAEKPEDQEAAEAALAASSEEGEKVNWASLAAATRTDLVTTVSMGASRCKRKSKWKDSDGNCPHEKWGKYESGDESSDSDSISKDPTFNTIATQTCSTTQSSVTQASSNTNAISPADIETGDVKQSVASSSTGAAFQLEQSASGVPPVTTPSEAPIPVQPIVEVPPHLLDMDQPKEDSFADIAAAADAAALAASTLADKKGISDQPAACPLCNAIIRQSRNLRRHLELKHFGKKPKKGKGGKRRTLRSTSTCDTDTESNAGSVADTTVIEHVQVEMKSPSVYDVVMSSMPPSGSNSPTQTPPPKHHTLTELLPAHQHHNVEAYLHQQQLQQLDSFHHMAPPSSNATYQIPYPHPHPHPHLSMLRGDPHSILGAEAITFRQQQLSTSYSGGNRSSNHQ